jgi:hypothetical protein
MAAIKVTVKKDGIPDYLAKLKNKLVVTVGIHEPEGGAAKEVPDGVQSSGERLIDVAESHEFGIGVPQRAFVRGCVDEQESELKSKLSGALKTALAPGGRGAEQQMARFGLYVVGQMQERISQGIPPELAPSTKKYKESLNLAGNAKNTPLILTGQLRSSIRSKVEVEK